MRAKSGMSLSRCRESRSTAGCDAQGFAGSNRNKSKPRDRKAPPHWLPLDTA